jgi:hypothetical protein
MPTKVLLGDRQTISPDDAAGMFLHGLSMDQFLITGAWSISIVSGLKGPYKLSYSVFIAPFGLFHKKYWQRKVAMVMK